MVLALRESFPTTILSRAADSPEEKSGQVLQLVAL